MRLRKVIPMVCVALVSLSGAFAQRKPSPSPERPQALDARTILLRNLTSDQWVKDLGGKRQPELYVYAFSKNGSYKFQLFTDYGTEPLVGEWRLTRSKDGKTHLVLANQRKRYYWLPQDSVIQYDKNKDVLLLSGEKYVGVQQLRRQKVEPKAD